MTLTNNTFIGEYAYSLDSKGRVNIPAKFRQSLSDDNEGTFVIARGMDACIWIYPLIQWKDIESNLRNLSSLSKQFDGNLSKAFEKTKTKFFIISFTSDWLYPTSENKEIVIALNSAGADVGFIDIESDKGHDSFLLDVPDFLK